MPTNRFNPNSDDYDYKTARDAGLSPGPDGHWPSRDPRTGMQLKGRAHPTFKKGIDADTRLGYEHNKGEDGRDYTTEPVPAYAHGGIVLNKKSHTKRSLR